MKLTPDKTLIFGTMLGIVAFYLILGIISKTNTNKKEKL